MTDHEVLMSVAIDARKRQIEVTTLQRGKGRHTHYASIKQVPPELRGEAFALIREAVLASGYASLAELDSALTTALVVPEKETGAEEPGAAASQRRGASPGAPAKAADAAPAATADAGGKRKAAAASAGAKDKKKAAKG
jgi:hypothetical protein